MQIWSVWKKVPKILETGTSNPEIYFAMVFFTLQVVPVVFSCCYFGSDEKILFYYPGWWDGK